MSNQVIIKILTESDIPSLVESFYKASWDKPISLFKMYLQEQHNKERVIWVALIRDQYVGYITLKWQSLYEPFSSLKIPEIMDFNILPSFRNKGIGSKLLAIAEKEAPTRSNIVGLGVGLYGGNDRGYGPAQKLYVKKGYIPDGRGVTYNYDAAIPGESFPLDDDLCLWFTKELESVF